jgi:hypothetical protein
MREYLCETAGSPVPICTQAFLNHSEPFYKPCADIIDKWVEYVAKQAGVDEAAVVVLASAVEDSEAIRDI